MSTSNLLVLFVLFVLAVLLVLLVVLVVLVSLVFLVSLVLLLLVLLVLPFRIPFTAMPCKPVPCLAAEGWLPDHRQLRRPGGWRARRKINTCNKEGLIVA